MRISRVILIITLILSMFVIGCSSQASSKRELTVSAAASLMEPLQEIAVVYENENNIKININFGSSGTLQKQIEQGAPVDVFISAGKSEMYKLIENGIADGSTYSEILSNSLVLIVSDSYDKNVNSTDFLKNEDIKLALGEVSTVPAGRYAAEFLKSEGLWGLLERRIVYAKDVKAVVNYVENGDAQAGIVYGSDAVNLKNSHIAYNIPGSTHQPIVYPAAVMKNSGSGEESLNFIKYLKGKYSKEVFKKYNFTVKDN